MSHPTIRRLQDQIANLEPVQLIGRVASVNGTSVVVRGLADRARMGDHVAIHRAGQADASGEVITIRDDLVWVLPDSGVDGIGLGDRASILGAPGLAPGDHWIGRVIDPFGAPLDGRPLAQVGEKRDLKSSPPMAATRQSLGERLETGMAIFNTLLPIVKGQRVGLFAGSGVGKSSLIAHLAKNMQADVVVLALVGERGRELREFVENTLGDVGMSRAVVVAATSDQSALVRRRCPLAAMAVAEHFRDQGVHVLLLTDSITRFAEAHREVAVASGELPALRGYPPSTAHQIMSLCERAGPGAEGTGFITALFSVLVAGSDMDEPVADILRGVLDGHVVLDRKIAERGRYPAIDFLRSVSRSLPAAASVEENQIIAQTRRLIGAYSESETMIKAGLYKDGSDPLIDQAIKVHEELDAFLAKSENGDITASFAKLQLVLRKVKNPTGLGR